MNTIVDASPMCPQCGGDLQPDVIDSLCPVCLLGEGFESSPGRRKQPAVGIEEVRELFPEWEIQELLGSNMGTVFRVDQPVLKRTVALKVIVDHYGIHEAVTKRFEQEAESLALLKHANIVAIHEFGKRDDLYYFVMEFVAGQPLRRTMRDGGMTPGQIGDVAVQLCSALNAAHRQGVIHRDLKPENVIVTAEGHVKLIDFGLAKRSEHSEAASSLTETGHVLGTAAYMSPEQHDPNCAVDALSDTYSLGVLLYEMLTGSLPRGRFPRPSETSRGREFQVDPEWNRLVMQMLEHDPEKRPQDLKTVQKKLEHLRFKQTTPGVAFPAVSNVARNTTFTSNNSVEEKDEMTKKKPWALALIASVAGLVMLVGVGFLIANGVAEDETAKDDERSPSRQSRVAERVESPNKPVAKRPAVKNNKKVPAAVQLTEKAFAEQKVFARNFRIIKSRYDKKTRKLTWLLETKKDSDIDMLLIGFNTIRFLDEDKVALSRLSVRRVFTRTASTWNKGENIRATVTLPNDLDYSKVKTVDIVGP